MVVIDPLFGACEMGIACRVPPGIALILVKPRAAMMSVKTMARWW